MAESALREWTVQLERRDGDKGRIREQRTVEARSEDEAIGMALRQAGLHDGWEVCGWWPTSR